MGEYIFSKYNCITYTQKHMGNILYLDFKYSSILMTTVSWFTHTAL